MLRTIFASLLTLTTAHFILEYPPSAGFNDDKEPTFPCGSFTPDPSKAINVTVDRFSIMIYNVHPVGEWSFRGTANKSASDWTPIVSLVNTTGVGPFCLDYMSTPSAWAGQQGVLQVVDNSPDGILFQCAPVNWVSGSNNTIGAACSNANSSAFTATWTKQESFKGENGGAASSSSASASAASSSSSSGMAPVATAVGSVMGGLGLLAAGLVL